MFPMFAIWLQGYNFKNNILVLLYLKYNINIKKSEVISL